MSAETTSISGPATFTSARADARGATMRAVIQSGYGTSEVLRVGRLPRPSAGPGEVVIAVRAAGLDRGTWHLMTGRPYLMRLMGFGFSGPKNPVPGIDVAGTVVEVGPNVTRFRVGDEVFGIGQGSFADFCRAREDKLVHKPASIGFEEAAVSGVSAITALQSLRDAGKIQAGDRVLVVGASGGVGTFAVQIARSFGAEVTGVCSRSKMDMVRSLGAHDVLDYTAGDFADGSRKYDLILDVGGNTPLARLRRALTETGRLVFVGGENGGDFTAGFGRQLWAMMLAPFTKQRFAIFATKEHFADLERIVPLLSDGSVKPVIDRRCSLDQVAGALRDLEAGRVRGKVAVAIG